jgi:hypothetical protein
MHGTGLCCSLGRIFHGVGCTVCVCVWYVHTNIWKHMKQITKWHALQLYVVVENVENLDDGWCVCVRAWCHSLLFAFASRTVREVWCVSVWYTWSRDLGTQLIHCLNRGVDNSGRNCYAWSRHLGTQVMRFLDCGTQVICFLDCGTQVICFLDRGTQVIRFLDRGTQLVRPPLAHLKM